MSSQLIARVLELTNEERAKAGLKPLKLNDKLANAADDHSDSMAEDDFFSHTGADGSSVADRVQSNGYEDSTVGENIAAGQPTAEAVVQAWMDSPGHRANILNANYTEIGIGYEFLENDTGSVNYNHYWTQVFGTSLNNNSVDDTEDNSDFSLNDTEVEETPIPQDNLDPDNSDLEMELEVPETATENKPEVDNSDEVKIDNSVENEEESDLESVEINDISDVEDTDPSEVADWQLDDSALEDSNVDNVTGNTDNSVLTGGDDWSFTDNSQSIETNELDSGSQTQFYDLFAKSWLGSLMENIENYEEIGMSDGDSTSFDNQQSFKSFMQQYQLTDV